MKPKKSLPLTVLKQASTPLEVKTLLVPTDFSPASLEALAYACRFAARFDATLVLLHVVEPPPQRFRDVPLVLPDDQVADQAREQLQALAATLPKTLRVETKVRLGRAFQEICELAEAAGADLILLATHGYTGLKHTLLGSVTERVTRHAPCPVLVLRAAPD